MKKKIQILMIHGGDTFKNRKAFFEMLKKEEVTLEKRVNWSKEYFEKELKNNFEIIRPRMPLADDAHYEEWKIYFEKYLLLLRNEVILLGYSLGGIFLVKYLSENIFPKKILATYLVAAPFDDSFANKDKMGGFVLKSDLSLLEKNSPNLNFFFSEGDDLVPASHIEKYRRKLPHSKIFIYKNKNGHFNVSKFPEIIKMIKSNLK